MAALVFEEFLSTPQVLEVFGQRSFVQAMLDFEAALARAQAAEGLMPPAAAEAIAAACDAGRLDMAAIVARQRPRRQPGHSARQAPHRSGGAGRRRGGAATCTSAAPART